MGPGYLTVYHIFEKVLTSLPNYRGGGGCQSLGPITLYSVQLLLMYTVKENFNLKKKSKSIMEQFNFSIRWQTQ
jgi:hypothetical protein